MENLLLGNQEHLLQIYTKDKLLDHNAWNFNTKNVNVYSSSLQGVPRQTGPKKTMYLSF